MNLLDKMNEYTNINLLAVCVASLAFLWLILVYYQFFKAQNQLNYWKKLEENVENR